MDKKLGVSLMSNPVLGILGPKLLVKLLNEFEQINYEAGTIIFEQGDAADAYYIIVQGQVDIIADDVMIAELPQGQGFGEMALLNNQPRNATARAKDDVSLIKISRAGFQKIVQEEPKAAQKLYNQNLTRLRYMLLLNTIRSIFGIEGEQLIGSMVEQVQWETYQAGEVVFHQGDTGDDFFMVVVGRLSVSFNDGFTTRTLGEIGSASLFGEDALLQHTIRSATITAIRETTVVRISQSTFDSLLSQSLVFARQIMTTIVQRQHQNIDDMYVQKPTSLNFAIIPLTDQQLTKTVVENLVAHIGADNKVYIVDRQTLDSYFDVENAIESVPEILLRQWITGLEQQYKFIFLIAGDEESSWLNWVVDHSDRLLFVASANDNPTPGQFEHHIIERSGKRHSELILLHEPDVVLPQGTANWLNPRHIHRHHHIRKQDSSHYARLARLLTGNGIGIVFGGGGARGYAHIGIIQALLEADIPVDAIGSVSMGAVVSAGWLVAMQEQDPMEYLQYAMEAYGSRKMLLDMTVPLSALMRSQKVSTAMHNIYGDRQIEDFWLPFFCVSTNLNKGSLNIHSRGMLHKAVRASLSIPGVFSPVVRDGDLTVDGGVLNNFPVDIMRQYLEGGTIIGSVIKGGGTGHPYEIEDHIDGFSALLSRILPWRKRKRVPSIMKTIMGASSINAYNSQARYRTKTDFLLETDTAPYGTLDFDYPRELVKIGYEAHKNQIHQWGQETFRSSEQVKEMKNTHDGALALMD